MRYMPTVVSDPFLGIKAAEIPVAEQGALERCLERFCGALTDEEQAFVDRAINHRWTIRVIVDALLEKRGAEPVALDFNWRSI